MTQIYDIDQDDNDNCQNAEEEVEKRFRKPLYAYTYPPRADVCFEGKSRLIVCQSLDHIALFNPMTDLHSETGKHQTRWKFSSRGRHPHWMIPLSRCLFRCSEIILSSVFNMQLIRMLYSHIVHETWQWPFSTWPRRSWMKFELFVLIITNDCVRLKWSMFLCRWRTTSVTRLDMRLPAHLWLRLSIFAPPKDYRTERTEVGYTLREEDKL